MQIRYTGDADFRHLDNEDFPLDEADQHVWEYVWPGRDSILEVDDSHAKRILSLAGFQQVDPDVIVDASGDQEIEQLNPEGEQDEPAPDDKGDDA